ncbi:MAG: cupin domain-containing protein [Acetobacteraceae bacterium]
MRLLLFLPLLAWVPAAQAADTPSVTVETLLKTEKAWDGVAYEHYPAGPPELTVLKISIPPRTALPWHTHPMPNAAYVLSGELLVEKQEGGLTKRLGPGDTLPEMVGSVHRGVTGEQGAVLIVFYAGTKGMPLSQQ